MLGNFGGGAKLAEIQSAYGAFRKRLQYKYTLMQLA
jgi:hypothetical protein